MGGACQTWDDRQLFEDGARPLELLCSDHYHCLSPSVCVCVCVCVCGWVGGWVGVESVARQPKLRGINRRL